ncbi:MAG: AMP-binding protein, partial [bacterium]|nr:AMP-binding protein [bacterium]
MISDVYKLAPMQAGMLFHALMEEGSTAYFEQTAVSVKGDIDSDLVEKSFNFLVERYDILRTIFHYETGKEPVQVVLKQRKCKLRFEEITHLSDAEQGRYMETFRLEERERGFDLKKDMLMKLALFRTGSDTYKFYWSFHHILMDGWCLGILFNELFQIYGALKKGGPVQLEPVTQYVEYVKWLDQQDKEEGLRFWQEYLDGCEESSGVPKSAQPSRDGKYRPAEHRFVVDEELTGRLRTIAQDSQVTLNTLLQGVWGILLQRYNNSDDVVFGAVVSGRPAEIEGIAQMVGLFINTVPVRVRSGGTETFVQILGDVQEKSVSAKSYEYLPLPEIQARSFLKRELLDHIMVFENYPIQSRVKNGNKDHEHRFQFGNVRTYEQTNYHFNIIAGPGKRLGITFNYNALVHGGDFVESIAGHFNEVLKQIAADPHIRKRDIEIITPSEKHRLLHEFNDTATGYPKDKTIHQLFEEQVARTPDRIAVIDHRSDKTHMTYSQLNQKSNQLSYRLREQGVAPGGIAGLMMESSVEMVIAVLGVLKAGAAYLPIDPGYPQDRVDYMLADSNAKILLSELSELSEVSMGQQASPTQLCYIIYTSGTTGRPRGVMVEHRSLVNLCFWHNRRYSVTFSDRATKYAGIGFDAS